MDDLKVISKDTSGREVVKVTFSDGSWLWMSPQQYEAITQEGVSFGAHLARQLLGY